MSLLAQARYAWQNQLYWKPSGVVVFYSCHSRNKVTPLRLSSWCTVGQGYGGTCGWGGRKQPLLQRSRIEPIGQGPGEARHLGTLHVRCDGGSAEAQTPGNLPITESDRPFETSHFVDLTHR